MSTTFLFPHLFPYFIVPTPYNPLRSVHLKGWTIYWLRWLSEVIQKKSACLLRHQPKKRHQCLIYLQTGSTTIDWIVLPALIAAPLQLLKKWGKTRQTRIAASNSSDNSLCHPPAWSTAVWTSTVWVGISTSTRWAWWPLKDRLEPSGLVCHICALYPNPEPATP